MEYRTAAVPTLGRLRCRRHAECQPAHGGHHGDGGRGGGGAHDLRSLREIAVELQNLGFVNERRVMFSASSVASMLARQATRCEIGAMFH